MNDWIQLVASTIVAPGLAALVAYLVTRRKELAGIGKIDAETNGVLAQSEKTFREMFYDESEKRRMISQELDEKTDAFNQAVEENSQLRAQARILRDQVLAMGSIPLTDLPKTDTKPRGVR